MFTPVHTSLGAFLLFNGSFSLLLHNGRVFGFSSILSACVFHPNPEDIAITAGLVSSLLPVYWIAPSLIPVYQPVAYSLQSVLSVLGLGLLIGWGTKVNCEYSYETHNDLKTTERRRHRMVKAAPPAICSAASPACPVAL
jgi:hypothetical protein